MVGTTAVGLALAGHVAGGGSAPTPPALGLVTAATVAGSVALSNRRWTLIPLVSVLLGVQAAFHVAFGHLAHSHAVHHVHTAASPHVMSGRMVAGHLVAALLTAVLLRRGEDWCWSLAALLTTPVRAVRAVAADLPGRAPTRIRAAGPTLARKTSLRLDAHPRRGPPALTLA
jgi:hypothetical protein